MLDNSEANPKTTLMVLLALVALLAVMFSGLADKSSEKGCLTLGDELMEQGGKAGMSQKEYLHYKSRIEATCSKKIAREILTKAERNR